MTIPAYPLQWPAGWKRTQAAARMAAKFSRKERMHTTRSDGSRYSYMQTKDLSIAEGTNRVRESIKRMGVPDDDLVISTNLELRLDGLPLSDAAVRILEARQGAPRPFPLSSSAMLALLQQDLGQPYTVHGFRATFHTWASEEGDWPEHVIDAALGHKIKDEVKAAYRRGALLQKRRALMTAWAEFLR